LCEIHWTDGATRYAGDFQSANCHSIFAPDADSLALDGETRPILRGAIQTAAGGWVEAPFLVDTGADLKNVSSLLTSAVDKISYPHQV
jgi:hypothetical protein